MQPSIRQVLSLFSCLLLVGLAISGCGGMASSSTTSSNSMVLNVGQVSDGIAFFPLYIAEQEGFFKDEGITLGSRPRLGTGAKLATALRAGSIDIAAGVFTDVFNLATVDSEVRAIGSLTNGYYIDIAVGKSFEQTTHLTKDSSLADKVNALRGKKIGITGPGSGTEALVIYLFKQQGLDAKKDAVLVNLGSDYTGAIAALQSGRVDVLSMGAPVGQEVESQGFGDILISPVRGDIPSMVGETHAVFFSRTSIMDAKPQAMTAFIRAMGKAEAFIHDQPQEKVRVLLQQYLKLDQKTTDDVYATEMPILAQDPRITQKGYDIAAQFHMQAGLIKKAPSYNDIVAVDTINKALA